MGASCAHIGRLIDGSSCGVMALGPAAEAARAWAEGAAVDLPLVGAGAVDGPAIGHGPPSRHLTGDAPRRVLVVRPPLHQRAAGAPAAGGSVPATA